MILVEVIVIFVQIDCVWIVSSYTNLSLSKYYSQTHNSQIYLRLLQQDDPCQKSPFAPVFLMSTVQAKQFSPGELKGSSLHPNCGTRVLLLAHSHTPSTSISFPDVQYCLLLLLPRLLTRLTIHSFSCPVSTLTR